MPLYIHIVVLLFNSRKKCIKRPGLLEIAQAIIIYSLVVRIVVTRCRPTLTRHVSQLIVN